MTKRTPFSALQTGAARAPLVAVDLGYSARNPTCGLAWTGFQESVEMQFGDAIVRTHDALRSFQWEAVLVIEAVLSTYHQENGNPDIRGAFEQGRGWYYGAGVLSFAAALRFLRMLASHLPRHTVVPLAEAFLSNKDTPSGHAEDATNILNNFWNRQSEHLRAGVEPASTLIAGVPSVRVF